MNYKGNAITHSFLESLEGDELLDICHDLLDAVDPEKLLGLANWSNPVGVTVNLSDEDLFDAITESGAYSWGPWYLHLAVTGPLSHHVEIDCEGTTGEGTVTPASIREAISALRAKYPNAECGVAGIDLSDPECDSDFDAISADAVIQQIVLGDVIFG